jgi:hypothetical protein
MKEENRSKPHRNSHAGLQKGLIIGLLIGALLGFLIPFLISGTLPFTESYSMGLGDMKELVTIFYLYCIAGGAVLGFIIGLIIGTLVDFIKR